MLLAGNDVLTYQQMCLPYYAGYLSSLSKITIPTTQTTILFQTSNLIEAVDIMEKMRNESETNTFIINFPDKGKYYKKLLEEYNGIHKYFFQDKALNVHKGKVNLTRPYYENSEIETILFGYTKKHSNIRVFIVYNELFKRISGQSATSVANLSKASKSIQLSSDSIKVYARHNNTLRTLSTENVLGFIKGSKYPDQFVVVMAHYDHLGKKPNGDVYNGADDNASSVAVMMEVAQSFSKATEVGICPEYSVLFVAFTGEEIGLFGSKYFLASPEINPKNIVAAINMDMLGSYDKKHESTDEYVYAVAHKKFKKCGMKKMMCLADNEVSGINIDFTPGFNLRLAGYLTSDQYFFIQNDIPSISLSTGLSKDYHTINDTYDKINYKNMENISRMVFLTTWQLANNKKKL